MVANPRAVRHFAVAMMERSKTDPLDAQVLREYATRMPFQKWQPPSATALKLVAIARRMAAVTEMITAEKNRRHAASLSGALSGYVRLEVARSLQNLQRSVVRLHRAAEALISDEAELFERYQLLRSIPGFGPTSALHVLAELSLLAPDLDIRQWVAAAGLDPRHGDSGTSVHRPARISKLGNARLRHALYMPALVAIQHQPHLRGFYLHLLERGKAKMQAVVAVMRKLLHAIYGMFHHHQTFDGSKLYALPETTSAALEPAVACA
jgi:transposase